MAVQLLADGIFMEHATFHLWMRVWHTPRFLQVVLIQCFSGVMAVQLLACGILEENATFHLWMRVWNTPRFLQVALNQDLRFLILLQEQVLKQTLHGVAEFAWELVLAAEWESQDPGAVLVHQMLHATTGDWGSVKDVPSKQLLGNEQLRSMQHSTFGWGCDIHPGFRRWLAYGASPQWWPCSCLRT